MAGSHIFLLEFCTFEGNFRLFENQNKFSQISLIEYTIKNWLMDYICDKSLYNQPKELGKIAEFFCNLRGLESSKTADIIRNNTIEAIPKLAKLCT